MSALRARQFVFGWLLLVLPASGPPVAVVDAWTSEPALHTAAIDKDCCAAAHGGRVCPMRHRAREASRRCRLTCGRGDPQLCTLLMPGMPGPYVSGIAPADRSFRPMVVLQQHVLLSERTPELPPPRHA